jgi:hypothetical protein
MRKPSQNLPWPMARCNGLSGIFNIVSENPLGGRAPSLAVILLRELPAYHRAQEANGLQSSTCQPSFGTAVFGSKYWVRECAPLRRILLHTSKPVGLRYLGSDSAEAAWSMDSPRCQATPPACLFDVSHSTPRIFDSIQTVRCVGGPTHTSLTAPSPPSNRGRPSTRHAASSRLWLIS